MFSRKKRFSSEYTMLSILEYLYNNSQKIPVSKFNIVNNTPGIKSQRPDRVSLMMESLQASSYIKSSKITNVTVYQITEKGIEEYTRWIKNFLEFARTGQSGL